MTKKQVEKHLQTVETVNNELRKEVIELRLKLDAISSALTTMVNKLK